MVEKRNSRVFWIDVLRIYATIMVITIHCNRFSDYDLVWSSKWIEYKVLGAMQGFAVPCFIMLSGMLMLKKDIPVKTVVLKSGGKALTMRIIQLLIIGTISLLYNSVFSQDPMGKVEGFQYGISNYSVGAEYISVLFGLYMVTPFLREIIKNNSLSKLFIVLGLFFTFIIPAIIGVYENSGSLSIFVNVLHFFDLSEIFIPAGAAYLFFMGYWIDRIKLGKSIWFKIGLGFLFLICIICNFCFITMESKPIIMSVIGFGRYYGGYISLRYMIYAGVTILFFKSVFIDFTPPNIVKKITEFCGKKCIVVFLTHVAIFSTVGQMIPVVSMGSFIIETVLLAILIFFIGIVFAFFLEKVPMINRILF